MNKCDKHFKKSARHYDKERGSSTSRGYDKTWAKMRNAYLSEHPYCEECLRMDRLTEAQCVDHIDPFRDRSDPKRLNWENLQALCMTCHSAKTAREDGGFGN